MPCIAPFLPTMIGISNRSVAKYDGHHESVLELEDQVEISAKQPQLLSTDFRKGSNARTATIRCEIRRFVPTEQQPNTPRRCGMGKWAVFSPLHHPHSSSARSKRCRILHPPCASGIKRAATTAGH